jgi:tRNA nucleotidyltransferase/poly(A) polymerase
MNDARIREIMGGEEAWIVGGAVRDALLERPVVDLDVACRDPEDAARRYARRFGGAPFPLSERHGAWRVVEPASNSRAPVETVDFTPLRDGIEVDLATRDFTLNAIALPVAGGEPRDPYGGRFDLRAGVIRAVSDDVFEADPLRLLRAVRLSDELDFRLDEHTEELIRASTPLVGMPAGERILGELHRLSAAGYRRLHELGLLEPLAGSLDGPLEGLDDPDFRLVAVFGDRLSRFPISNEQRRYARALLRARSPEERSSRAVHRFRRDTEPWALDALAYLRRWDLAGAVEEAREADPGDPLVRGDELGLEPGPLIGRILAAIEEERAAGTIATRDEALALARRLADEEVPA